MSSKKTVGPNWTPSSRVPPKATTLSGARAVPKAEAKATPKAVPRNSTRVAAKANATAAPEPRGRRAQPAVSLAISRVKAPKTASTVPSSAMPSTETRLPWIHAQRLVDSYPEGTERCGKWLVFVPRSQVDEVWTKIEQATVRGELGGDAKVSTARPNPNASKRDTHVICVHTYDIADLDDVRRVREGLRALGIVSKTPYKTDQATYDGKYAVKGDRRVSSLFE